MFPQVPTFCLAKIPEIILQVLLRKIHLSHFVQSSCWLCTDTRQFHSPTSTYSFYNTRIRRQMSKCEQPTASFSRALNPCGFIGSCSARRFGGRFHFSTPSQAAHQGGGSEFPVPNPISGLRSHCETRAAHAPPYLLRDVFSILPQDPAANQDLAAKERGGVSGGGGTREAGRASGPGSDLSDTCSCVRRLSLCSRMET